VNINKGIVGEDRGSKEMDRCPLTLPPLQKCSVMMHKDRCKGNLTDLRRQLHSSLAKGNPK
jgi:hypothetical protein